MNSISVSCLIGLGDDELSKKIVAEQGRDAKTARLYSVIANNKKFREKHKNFLSMDVDSQYQAIDEFYKTEHPDVNSTLSDKYGSKDLKGQFETVAQRVFALRLAANAYQRMFVTLSVKDEYKGKTANDYMKKYVNDLVAEEGKKGAKSDGAIMIVYKELLSRNKDNEEFNKLFASLKKKYVGYDVMINLMTSKFANKTERYYGALLYETFHNYTNFKNDVFRDSRLQLLNRQLVNRDSVVEGSELLNDPEYDGTNPVDIDETDKYITSFEGKLGDYVNAMKHIDTFIRAYLNSLPRLKSLNATNKDAEGNIIYDYDNDNVAGIADTMDAEDCIAAIYHYSNSENLDTFIASIKQIALNNPEYASLIILANNLEKDKHMAYYFYTTFGKNLVSKIQVYNDGKWFSTKISNYMTDSKSALKYTILNTFRQSFLVSDVNRAAYHRKELSNYLIGDKKFKIDVGDQTIEVDSYSKMQSSYDTARANGDIDKAKETKIKMLALEDIILDHLNEIFKNYVPALSKNAIAAYLLKTDSNGNKNFGDRANKLNILAESIIQYARKTQQNYDAKENKLQVLRSKKWHLQNDEGVEEELNLDLKVSEINRTIYDEIRKDYLHVDANKVATELSEEFDTYVTVPTELNSVNVDGNMSSDVINNNILSSLMHTLNGVRDTETGLSALDNFGAYRSQSAQYKYSNIMFEKKDSTGKRYGLFKNINGVWKPTSYAKNLVKAYLFDGASNEADEIAATYKNLSKQDYEAAAFVNYFRSPQDTSLDIGETAIYFLRTQSDAPKTFGIRMTRYNTRDMFTISPAVKQALRLKSEEMFNRIAYEKNPKFSKSSAKKVDLKVASRHLTSNNLYAIRLNNKSKLFKDSSIEEGSDVRFLRLYYEEGDNVFSYVLKGNVSEIKGEVKLNDPSLVKVEGTYSQMPVELRNAVYNIHEKALARENKIVYTVNVNHPVFEQLRNMFLGELQQAAIAIQNMFDLKLAKQEDGVYYYYINRETENKDELFKPILNPDINERDLYDIYHGKRDKNGKFVWAEKDNKGNWHLTGRVFESDRFILFDPANDGTIANYGKNILDKFFRFDEVYNEEAGTGVLIKTDAEGNLLGFDISDEANTEINNQIRDFILHYARDINRRVGNLERTLNNDYLANMDNYIDFAINYHIAYNNMNELFEGDSKFYKDAQDFLKRAKETQAGGSPYGFTNYAKKWIEGIHTYTAAENSFNAAAEHIVTYTDNTGNKVSRPILLRDGFKAITVNNTIKVTEFGKNLVDILSDGNAEKGINGKNLMDRKRAEKFAKNFAGFTKVNDAQSYITFEEWVRRIVGRGQYDKYKGLIDKVLSGQENFNEEELDAFIQVQKNFYYDQYYDARLGIVVPRQIKNAEFVLVPQFIKGTELEQVYNMMMQSGVDQLNTVETTKAGKSGIINIWDNNGAIADVNSKEWQQVITDAKETAQDFWYNYLYTQQEVPQHVDSTNKAGIQIMKKLMDNIPDKGHPLSKVKERFFSSYTSKIRGSFDKFARFVNMLNEEGKIKLEEIETDIQDTTDEGDLIFDEEGKPVYKKRYKLNFDKKEIYALLYNEAKRLGITSNELDYVTLDKENNPNMPSYFTTFSNKMESIVQSLINSRITRQTLPGFHAAQVTGLGFGGKYGNKVLRAKEYKGNPLRYRPINNKGDIEAYIEVVIPRPKKFDGLTDEEIFAVGEDGKNMLERAEVDTFIGYRIPTEGKQSLAVMKIVGFVDKAQGSTIIVPDEWVAQTGSDFDVDSIYAMMHNINVSTKTDKNGNKTYAIHKYKMTYKTDDRSVLSRYNSYIKEALRDFRKEDLPFGVSNRRKEINRKFKELESKRDTELEAYYKELTDKYWNDEKESNIYRKKLTADERREVDKYFRTSEDYRDRVKNFVKDFDGRDDNSAGMKEFVELYKGRLNAMDKFELYTDESFEKLKDDEFNTIKHELERTAEALKLMDFDTFKSTPVEDQNSSFAKDNDIIDCAIEIASSDSSIEEQTHTSMFVDIVDNRDDIYEGTTIGKMRKARTPYNFFDQADYQEETMSGTKLKAISVSRDTFASVGNVSHSRLAKGFKAVYEEGYGVTYERLVKAYPDVEVKNINGRTFYIVTHKDIGWSANNRNVVDEFITVYTSETTAHHLDAVKEGGILNLNEFTFGVYKTLPDTGSDYRTAIAFIAQPAVTRIVQAYERSNSIFNRDRNGQHIITAVKSLAMSIGLKAKNNLVDYFTNIDDIFAALNTDSNLDLIKELLYEEAGLSRDVLDKFKFGFKDADLLSEIPLSRKLLVDRFKNKGRFDSSVYSDADLIKNLFDVVVLMQYYNLSGIAETINNYMQVTNPDKFGAKQSLFSTFKVYDDITHLSEKKSIISERTNDDLLLSIYPNINKGLEVFATQPQSVKSVYPSLHAFLRYSTITSIMMGRELFETQSYAFRTKIMDVFSYLKNNRPNEETYNDFKNYVITEAMWSDVLNNEDEKNRLFGYSHPIDSIFSVEDLKNPTDAEKQAFLEMTPAQKAFYVKKTFEDSGIFKYIDINVFNQRTVKGSLAPQKLKFNLDNVNIETLYEEFRKTYYNNNFFAHEAAKDLIKYARVVEGFRFGRGNVAKVITNDAIRDEGILDMIDISKSDKLLNLFNNDAIYTDYVRSHRDKVPTFVNPRNENGTGYELLVKPSDRFRYVIQLADYAKADSKARRIGIVDYNEDTNVILVNPFLNIKTDKTSILYKAIIKDNNLYYIPLNTLENNEHGTWSSNQANNIFYKESYYHKVVNDLEVGISQHAVAAADEKYIVKQDSSAFFHTNWDILYGGATFGIENIIKSINTHFGEQGIGNNALFMSSLAITDAFKRFGTTGSKFTDIEIDGINYLIRRINKHEKTVGVLNNKSFTEYLRLYKKDKTEFNKKYRSLNSSIKDLIAKAENNEGILNNIYMITPDVELVSAEKITEDDEGDLSTAAEAFTQLVGTMRDDKYKYDINKETLESLSKIGVKTYEKESLLRNLPDVARFSRNLIVSRSNFIKDNIDNFFNSGLPIDSPEFIKRLNDNETFRTSYLKFLNEYYDFISKYNGFLTAESHEDAAINFAIQEIKAAIISIRDNIRIDKANEVVVNKYLQNLSSDPLQLADILTITEGFHNIHAFASFITDSQEVGIPMMQIVLKEVMTHVDRDDMMGKEDARKWTIAHKERLRIAREAGQTFDWKNIIRNGKFVTDYNENLVKDLNDRLKELKELKREKPGSVEYYRKVLDHKKWIFLHFEQVAKNDYYVEKYSIENEFLTKHPEYYARYKSLTEEISNIREQTKDGKMSDENIDRIAEIAHNIRKMRSLTLDDEGLIPKKHIADGAREEESVEAAEALRKFTKEINELEREYFTRVSTDDLQREINHFQDIVNKYEVRDENGILLRSQEELDAIPEYVAAREWLSNNTTFEILDEIVKPVKEAYKALYGISEKALSDIDMIIEAANARDEFGIIDGRKFSKNQIQYIKSTQQSQYRRLSATKAVSLHRNRPSTFLVYNDSLHKAFENGFITERYNDVVKAINDILEPHAYVKDGVTRYKTSDMTVEELTKLYNLYDDLKNTRKTETVLIKGKEVTRPTKGPKFKYVMRPEEKAVFDEERLDAERNGTLELWLMVNTEEIKEKDSEATIRVPRRILWQTAIPEDCTLSLSYDSEGNLIGVKGDPGKYVNAKKTLARAKLRELTYYDTTPYYKQMEAEMATKSKEEYDAWFEANHVMNVDGEMEPLKIWRTRKYKAAKLESAMAGAVKDSGYKRIAKRKRYVSTPVEGKENPRYNNAFSGERSNYNLLANYRRGTGYDSNVVQSAVEKEVQLDLQKLFRQLVKTGSGRRFLDKGYVPAERKAPDVDAKFIGKQLAGTFGLYVNGRPQDVYDDVSFENDIIPDMPMLQILKDKSTKNYNTTLGKKPIRENFSTNEEFNAAIDEYNGKKRAITEFNEKVHQGLLNEDWDKVIPMFIERATRYNSLQENKQLLYYALNQLKRSKAFKDVLGKKNVPRNDMRSTDSSDVYQTESYDNAIKMLQTFINRVIYGRFKRDQGGFTTFGNLMQAHSSAKFMMLNVTGGIGNVMYGENQIFGEYIAKDYIGAKDYAKGTEIYYSGITSYIKNAFSPVASNLPDAIIKLLKVVDLDKVNDIVGTGIAETFKKYRDSLYVLQSGGEHGMQNRVMFAMMVSHKLLKSTDVYGSNKYEAQTLEMYKRGAVDAAMTALFANHPELKDLYDKYIANIKGDPNRLRDIAFRRTYVEKEFFNQLKWGKSKQERNNISKLQEEYIKLRNQKEKELEAQWKKEKNLYEQFDIKNGYAVFKDGSILANMDRKEAYQICANFKEKVQSVNKKIHGVYDKIGAARMEQEWYGGLAMQYHKHLYPGFMKRFRTQGYYNENRQTVEKGSYIALYDFLATPFKDVAKELKMTREQLDTMQSIQRYFAAAKDFLLNVNLNWNMLPASERGNILRAFSDIAGFTSAVLLATAARMLIDDDDKDNGFYNLAIYSSDRLATESMLYIMPWNEAKVLWRTPVAAQSTIGDLLSVMNLAAQGLIQGDDFSWEYGSGIYKGENKAKVLGLRQIPIYRSLNQVYMLDRKNTYFKLESNHNQDIAKGLADYLKGNYVWE